MIVGFVIFHEVEELDLVGPWEIFRMWSREPGGPSRCILVAEQPGLVTCSKGMRILADEVFESSPRLDYLVVPGGIGTRREVDNPVLIDFIAQRSTECKAVLSVCTGAFLLERAGLLAGKRATTHWRSIERLRQCSEVEVVQERFVRDGTIWTSAGVSAGIDMALAFVAGIASTDIAARVQLNAEYYPATTRYDPEGQLDSLPAYLTGG
jgi:transcriptional regulator GlxA family with amidase domain